MANPFQFLREWSEENVTPTAFDDEPTAKGLAAKCLNAAKDAGISTAGGSLGPPATISWASSGQR
jgi:hypothetical protein